jgi:hypothetical protein
MLKYRLITLDKQSYDSKIITYAGDRRCGYYLV